MSTALIEAPVSEFTLEVYSKPDCVQCTSTYRKAGKLRIEYVKATLDEDAEKNADAVREFGMTLGVASAPLCIVRKADGSIAEFWGGFQPTKLDEWGPKLDRQPAAEAEAA